MPSRTFDFSAPCDQNASRNAPIQAGIAEARGDDYGLALALVAGITALVLIGWTAIGPERRDVAFVEEGR